MLYPQQLLQEIDAPEGGRELQPSSFEACGTQDFAALFSDAVSIIRNEFPSDAPDNVLYVVSWLLDGLRHCPEPVTATSIELYYRELRRAA